MMIPEILENLKHELIHGFSKRKHPFRYFSFGTIQNNNVSLRTVVLRKVLPDFTTIIYTDKRSQKVAHIKENNTVSALFYHPKKLLQIRLDGKAIVVTDKEELKPFWSVVGENAKKDYTTALAPGAIINNPDAIDYSDNEPNFCIIKIIPNHIEYLQLKRPNHIRVGFDKTENGFEGSFLVP